MMNHDEFCRLALRLSAAWNAADIESALDCFTLDGIYMQPPDVHFFQGHDQLRLLFTLLQPGNNWLWHGLWFDEVTQTGVGEFTFHEHEAHGVAVLFLRDSRVSMWREYQWHGSMLWREFITPEHHRFRLTVDNLHS